MRKRFQPRSRIQDERLITRYQRSFEDGLFEDFTHSEIPDNSVTKLENFLNKGAYLEGRLGTKQYGNTKLPAYDSRILDVTRDTTNNRVTINSGGTFSSADVGRYLVYDDGVSEEIYRYVNSSTVEVAMTNNTPSSTSSSYVRGKVHSALYHKNQNKLLIHLGDKLYISTDSSLDSAWTEIVFEGLSNNLLSDSTSHIKEFEDEFVIFNDNGNIYKTYLTDNVYYTVTPKTFRGTFSDTATGTDTQKSYTYPFEQAEELLVYKRRYIYTLIRKDSNGAVVYESAPFDPDNILFGITTFDNADYLQSATEYPIGPEEANYETLTGDTLVTPYDVYTGWNAIDDGTFKITFNGVQKNIVCDFTKYAVEEEYNSSTNTSNTVSVPVRTMEEVAEVIERAIQKYFETAVVEYTGSKFNVSNKKTGGTVDGVTTGSGGTDISADLQWDSGSSPTTTSNKILHTPVKIDGLSGNNVAGVVAPVTNFTHYRIYSTLDVGVNGTDPITGLANNSEVYIWHSDIPSAKVVSGTADSSGTFIADSSFFDGYDTDNTDFTLINEATGTKSSTTITTIVSRTEATASAAVGVAGEYILGQGCLEVIKASKSGTTVTVDAGSYTFGTDHLIIWEDGEVDIVVSKTSPTEFEVRKSGTKSSQGLGIQSGSRQFTDIVSDDTLRARLSTNQLKNRFFESLPSTETGDVSSSFMTVLNKNDNFYYYSPLGNKEHLGSYHPAHHFGRIDDRLTAVKSFPTGTVIFGESSTTLLPQGSIINIDNSNVGIGESIPVISNTVPVSTKIGISDIRCLSEIDNNNAMVITNEPGIRIFNTTQYDQDLSENRIKNALRQIDMNTVTTSYDDYNGFMFWATPEYNTTTGASKSLKTSYRFGLKSNQGFSFSKNTGDAWVYPDRQSDVIYMFIRDSNSVTSIPDNQLHTMVIDTNFVYPMDLTTRPWFVGSWYGKSYTDRQLRDGTAGTSIAPVVRFKQDRGEYEHFFIEHLESYIYTRPHDNNTSYQNGLEIDVSIYSDDNTVTETSQARDIAIPKHMIAHERKAVGNRLQTQVSANDARIIIVGRQQHYKVRDWYDSPDNRNTTEGDNQTTLSNLVAWITRGDEGLVERVSNTKIGEE